MAGLLVIMGSGETAPTMVKPHRAIFERVAGRPAVMLDTPYGFQSNADDISGRAISYFAASVGQHVEVAHWRTVPAPGLARERALASLREAGWIFAGPGSPTYALRQWRSTAVPGAFVDTLARDGVVVMASAAALTLGSHAVPVYEIYKAGLDPYWDDGLDLVRQTCGLPAVVIPHYDNAEGGHHDTRFCYLGEARLALMEQSLPDESFVLGVDEHTAVVLDPQTGTASVLGNGTMTIRRAGHSVVHSSGSVVSFDAICAEAASGTVEADPLPPTPIPETVASIDVAPASLIGTARQLDATFQTALAARDIDGCVEAILAAEQALLDWSADTLTSDEGDQARALLRAMVVRLGGLAVRGVRDPREVVAPYVDALLVLRAQARSSKDFATSDWVRERLVDAGVEVHDTPTGVEWALDDPP